MCPGFCFQKLLLVLVMPLASESFHSQVTEYLLRLSVSKSIACMCVCVCMIASKKKQTPRVWSCYFPLVGNQTQTTPSLCCTKKNPRGPLFLSGLPQTLRSHGQALLEGLLHASSSASLQISPFHTAGCTTVCPADDLVWYIVQMLAGIMLEWFAAYPQGCYWPLPLLTQSIHCHAVQMSKVVLGELG